MRVSVKNTKLIARLVLWQKGKIYWPIFQLAELVFFRASTKYNFNVAIQNMCKIQFWEKLSAFGDSHTNTVICDHFAYPSRWRRKP